MTNIEMNGLNGASGIPQRESSTRTSAHARMTRDELLGRVAVLYLGDRLTRPDDPVSTLNEPNDGTGHVNLHDEAPKNGIDTIGGTARFIIDCLNGAQTAAIARAILADPDLGSEFEIKLPRGLVGDFNLPNEILTHERATYFRNAPCSRPALLLANTGDDEEQSLRELTPIGAPDLQADTNLWVQVASTGLLITEDEQRWWEQALPCARG